MKMASSRSPLRKRTRSRENVAALKWASHTEPCLATSGMKLATIIGIFWSAMTASWLLSGDDSRDYQSALEQHYRDGPPPDWQEHYVSAYASVHPWEDFAETWAHYLHIVDTLEMAGNFGMRVKPLTQGGAELLTDLNFDPYSVVDFSRSLTLGCHLSLQ